MMPDTGKITKESVNYRVADNASQCCGTCRMFDYSNNNCTLVRGTIFRTDVCDRWEKRNWNIKAK